MNNTEHLNFIYNRLKNVYNENENIDYMITFKNIIDNLQLQEARLLDAVHRIVELKIHPMNDDLVRYLSQKDFKMDEELQMLVKALDEQEEAIYNQYGISRQRSGKI